MADKVSVNPLNTSRVILDLCGGTGSWSRPYREAGYDVRVVTLPANDVRLFQAPTERIHGILAAPPCTHLSISGARWWKSKGDALLLEALSVADACLRLIRTTKPVWWALENPEGRLRRFFGPPAWRFSPHEFGDPWQKNTLIWGEHTVPQKNPIPWPPNGERGMERWTRGPYVLSPKPSQRQLALLETWGMLWPGWRDELGDNPDRATLRSITPQGFARAFFEANP